MIKCPFCQLLHDPTRSNCNDPATGALIRRAGPLTDLRYSPLVTPRPENQPLQSAIAGRVYKPVELQLTPFGALDLLVRRIDECGHRGFSDDFMAAYHHAGEVVKRERTRLSQLAVEMMQSGLPENAPTCIHHLEDARDAMDAVVAELQAANKDRTCGGMASLLLLDMIDKSTTMQSRIRAIMNAASSDAKFNVYCDGDGSWLKETGRQQDGIALGDVYTHDRTRALAFTREKAEKLDVGGAYRLVEVGRQP